MGEANTDETLDIECFIEEVKKYPEIWNVAAEEYHDRTKKRSAWIDICRVFCTNFEESDERDKNEICNKLIKKWRNIKDNFLKSIKKKTKSGQAVDTGRRYIYARQLSFLQQVGANTDTQSTLGGEDEEESQESNEIIERSDPSPPPRYEQNTRKRNRDLESTLIDFMKTLISSQSGTERAEPNADKSFFDSLIPSLSGFGEDQKLEFRCEVLNIIKRMRQQNAASCNTNLQPNYPGYPPIFQTPSNVAFLPTPPSSNYIPQPPPYQHLLYSHRPSSAPGSLTRAPISASSSLTLPAVSPSTSSTHSNTEDCLDIHKHVN